MSYPAKQPENPVGIGLSSRDILSASIKGWWLVALFVILGGLCGLIFHVLQPTQYEAGFSVLTGIDQTNVGELTQYEEDVMMLAVGNILYSPSTLDKVVIAAKGKGISLDTAGLQSSSSIERKLSTWQVRVHNPNPKVAEELASLWSDIGYSDIKEAYDHAITADGLSRYLGSLENCLAQAVTSEPFNGLCGFHGMEEVQVEISKTGARLATERLSSRGLSSGVMVDKAEKDLFPARPENFQTNQLVLAGGLTGFIIGVWAAQTRLASVFSKGRQRE